MIDWNLLMDTCGCYKNTYLVSSAGTKAEDNTMESKDAGDLVPYAAYFGGQHFVVN